MRPFLYAFLDAMAMIIVFLSLTFLMLFVVR